MSLVGQNRQLLQYTVWADLQHLDALADVEPEHLTLPTGTSFDSLFGTMAHILAGERVWLSRFVGNPVTQLPTADDFEDLAALRYGFHEIWSELEFFMASLSAEQLEADIHWVNTEGEAFTRPLWQPLVHMVNHSSYHRGQLTTLLRQLGYEPPATDLIYYLLAR